MIYALLKRIFLSLFVILVAPFAFLWVLVAVWSPND